MKWIQFRILATLGARGFASSSPPTKEGTGKCRCRCTPGLVWKCKEVRTRHTGTAGALRHPAQWFYGLRRALPGDQFVLPPSPADWWPPLPVGPCKPRPARHQPRVREPHAFPIRISARSSTRWSATRTRARPANTTTRPTLPLHPTRPTFRRTRWRTPSTGGMAE